MAEKNILSKKGGLVKVFVEMRVPKGQEAARSFNMATELNVTGFQVDNNYGPVSGGVPLDSKLAADLEEKRQETVIIRGTIEENKIGDLKAKNNVVKVWIDTKIAPFNNQEGQGEVFFIEPCQASGTCPIPPCDCDHGTAACSKGTISDVAQYLGVDQIWAAGYRGNGIVIGIVDGGISAQGRVSGGTIPRVIGGHKPDWGKKALWGGHGNMTATDAQGMAPQSQLYDIRLPDSAVDPLSSVISDAIAGFQWAINQHKANGTPHILSNSWGIFQENWDSVYASDPNHPFTRKVVEAINEGILVLFAAGNCGETCPDGRCGNDKGPGKSIWGANGHPRVMTVGAANIRDQFIGYSSQGPAALDLHKPDFCSISHFSGYFTCDTGTSAACPVAAGVVALLKNCKPTLTQDGAKQVLKDTAKNIGPAGWDKHSGSGIIQAKAAFNAVQPPKPKCQQYRTRALRYLAVYRRTKNLRYLCLYYRYLALYYRCLYQVTHNRRYLCYYYGYMSRYYYYLYKLTRNEKYMLLCRRYYNAFLRCRYK